VKAVSIRPGGLQGYVGGEGQDVLSGGIKPDPFDEPCGPLSRVCVVAVVLPKTADEVERLIWCEVFCDEISGPGAAA